MTSSIEPKSQNTSEKLLPMLHRLKRDVERLGELADAQRELIETGRTEELLALLGERQRLVDGFFAVQSTLEKAAGGEGEGVTGNDARREAQEMLGHIAAGLARIEALDAGAQAALEAARNAAHQELTGLGAARQARTAYLTPPTERDDNRFADQTG